MEKTKAQLTIGIEFLKFTFVAIIAIATAIGSLLIGKETIANANSYLNICYFLGIFVLIVLTGVILFLYSLINKLDSLEQ